MNILLPRTENFRFDHIAELRRRDGRLLETSEVEEEVDSLRILLSFSHGRWVPPMYIRGTSKQGLVVYEQWRDPLTSRFRANGSSWLDGFEARSLSSLWPSYKHKRSDHLWRKSIDLCTYWLVRSDTEFVGTDGGLILLQAAFERLAWHYLVLDQAVVTKAQFNDSKKYNAAAKLRLLLSTMSIPPDIPASLPELKAYASNLPHADGPDALTSIRNSLVHPDKIESATRKPIAEAYFLARNYLVLCLLKSLDYSGSYVNLTKLNRYKGEVEKVPWA